MEARSRLAQDGGARRAWPWIAALLLAHAVVCVLCALRLDTTADERTHIASGRILLERADWENRHLRYQGPIALVASQAFVAREDYAEGASRAVRPARLSLIPFALLCAGIVALWGARLFGGAGAAAALALLLVQPVWLGHASLAIVDTVLTAFLLAGAFALFEFARSGRWYLALLTGVAFGLAVDTKYLALLFLGPALLVCCAVGAWHARRAGGSVGRALWRGASALALAASGTWISLHIGYGFLGGFAPGAVDAYASAPLRLIARTPGLDALLRSLPRPLALGIDMQFALGHGQHLPYLDGALAPGHASYYLKAFAYKAPELVLLALLVGCGAGMLAADRSRRREYMLAALLLGAVFAPGLVYLSAFTTYQVGFRYVLWSCPIAAILASGLGPLLVARARASRAWLAGCALAAALVAIDLGGAFPNLIAYFNRACGGVSAGWTHFRDSNTEWWQLRDVGRARLTAKYGEGLAFLGDGDGPRIGRVAAYFDSFNVVDAQRPRRYYHWLDKFAHFDSVGSAWFVFDVTEVEFEQRARELGDDRTRSEFATALLGADRTERAREFLAAHPGAARTEHAVLLDGAGDAASLERLSARARAWLGLGRADRACAELGRGGEPLAVSQQVLLAEALRRAGRQGEAIELVLRIPNWEQEPIACLQYALACFELGKPLDGVRALRQGEPALRRLGIASLDAQLDEAFARGALWEELLAALARSAAR